MDFYLPIWNARNLPFTREAACSWAQEQGLVPTVKKCGRHRVDMVIDNAQQGFGAFFCPRGRSACGFRSVSKRTWFEESRLPPHNEIRLLYGFAHNESYKRVRHECVDMTLPPAERTMLSSETIAFRYQMARQMIVDAFSTEQHSRGKIGGPGIIVQIDESKCGKRKYHRGRLVEGHWVLGIGSEETQDFRMIVCPENCRSAASLTPIIEEHVAPGSTIWTDSWRGYCDLAIRGFLHEAVNHSKQFVSDTGVYTQRIEAQWRPAKGFFHGRHVPEEAFADHLCEYLWRRWNRKEKRNPFEALLVAIRRTYNDFRV